MRLQYTFMQRDEDRRLDMEGHVKSDHVDVSRTILVNGFPFEQLVEHNGQLPLEEEERKEKEKLDKLKRETPEQRAERIRNEEEENTSLVRELPKAFDFQRRRAADGSSGHALHIRTQAKRQAVEALVTKRVRESPHAETATGGPKHHLAKFEDGPTRFPTSQARKLVPQVKSAMDVLDLIGSPNRWALSFSQEF